MIHEREHASFWDTVIHLAVGIDEIEIWGGHAATDPGRARLAGGLRSLRPYEARTAEE
jgi:hypothetical protein